jgi:nucleoside-diphosphate-sugar epimerase
VADRRAVTGASSDPGSARAFVAGATGYTGRAVVQALAARGVETVAHVRPDSSALTAWVARFGAMPVAGSDHGVRTDSTPWNRVAMESTLTALRPTHVFALLGTTRARRRQAVGRGTAVPGAARGAVPDTYETVDYGLTACLLHAAVAAGRATQVWPRFIYLSAIGVSAGSSSRYMAARGRIEEELRGSGLSYVIARPVFISGPDREERRPAERLAATVVDGVLGFARALGARRLRERYASLTGPELAAALVHLAIDRTDQSIVAEADTLRAAAGAG